MDNKKALFESMPVSKAVWAMAVPTIITQLINIVYNYADTWFVGRSQNAAMVAALGVSFPVFVILAAIANLFGIGGASVISRALGAKDIRKARKTFVLCFWMGMGVAALYALIILTLRSRIIYLVGGDDADFAYISSYMFWTMAVGAIPTVGNMLCGHLIRSVGGSKVAGFGMSMGGVLNIVLDPLFMFVILPDGMEVTGAAIATMLSNTVAFVYFLHYIYKIEKARDSEVITIRPPELRGTGAIVPEVLVVGIPAALQTTLAMVSNIFANVLIRPYGSGAVAGMGIAKKINMIAFNTCMGMSIGVLPLLGYCYGARNFDRFRKIVRYAGTVVVLYGLVCAGLFEAFAPHLVRFFINEAESIRFGTEFLRVIGVASPMAAFSYLGYTMFQAAGRKKAAFAISVLRKGVLDIPLMFVLRISLAAVGVCLATPVAELLGLVVLFFLYRPFRRQMRRMEAETKRIQ